MTQKTTVTVTLNPALDRTASAPDIRPGPKLRCSLPQIDPGGGGINVSRAIAILGGQSTALAALGGPTGQAFSALLNDAGFELVSFPAPGDTRDSFTVMDEETAEQFRFVLPGPIWSAAQADELLAGITNAVPDGALVVLSGSQPPGIKPDFPIRLATNLRAKNVHLIVDTSGPALEKLALHKEAGLAMLRLNNREAAAFARRDLPDHAAVADFAARLVGDGVANCVVLATGADGSILVDGHNRLFCNSPPTPVRSKVGAGDSFVGAFTLAMARGASPAECLRQGCAGAAAAVMTDATDLCRAQDVEELLLQCQVRQI